MSRGPNKDKVSNYSLEEISRLLWNKRLENLFFCKSGQIDFWPLFLVKSFNVLAEPKSNNGYQSRKLMQTNASDTATCYQLLFSVTGDVSRLPIEKWQPRCALMQIYASELFVASCKVVCAAIARHPNPSQLWRPSSWPGVALIEIISTCCHISSWWQQVRACGKYLNL